MISGKFLAFLFNPSMRNAWSSLVVDACLLVVHFHSIPNVNALPPPAQGVPLKSIAFGSCNKERMDTDAELWESVTKSAPSAWVWMGDAIYPSGKGNYEEQVTDRKLRYGLQEAKPGYAKLSQGTPVVGTWDDHDYGGNDSGDSYEWKQESKQLLLDFMGHPVDSTLRLRDGIYSSYLMGEGANRVNLILLDLRWWRNSKDPLGETQWAWLEKQLGVVDNQDYDNNNGDATTPPPVLNILVSSTQVVIHDPVPIGDPFLGIETTADRWGHWSEAKNRLYAMIETSPVPTVAISGDAHVAEVSRDCDVITRWGGLLDITTSGLTHTRPQWSGQAVCNPQRVSGPSFEINWADAGFDWSARTATFAIRNKGGNVIYAETVHFGSMTTTECTTGQGSHLICGWAYVMLQLVAIVLFLVAICVCLFLVQRDSQRRKLSYCVTFVDWTKAPHRFICWVRGLPAPKRP